MISLIRIDDRLIHGQVMAVWARVLNIDQILVADDATAADPFTQQIMQLAMPASIQLRVATVEVAASLLAQAETDTTHTLVLLKSVDAAARLYKSYRYGELNVGGIGMAPGRKLIWRSIAASGGELKSLQQLRDLGVDVYWQMIPTDEKRRMISDK
ncbi:MAG: PTS sugar transporter subunit IIB [Chloroflexi bacterium]|nr:PTS sugar transporter subunit IIB [Chloroflexota bacterium]